jgi:uncharacterized membrane protein YidH (DUF202 family)
VDYLGEAARFIHILFGFIGLAAFWVPIFARKGAVNHVRFGKIFVRAAYVVLTMAGVALVVRLAGLIADGQGPHDQPSQFAFIVFLGYLTLVTFIVIRHGMGVLRYKRNPSALRSPAHRTLAYLAIAASAVVILYAMILNPPIKILLFALSPIGVSSGIGMLRYMRADSLSPRAWLYEHLGAMIGSGIAFHTAFAVFGSTRLIDIGLTGWVALIPWIAPAMIGIPATVVWTRHYRQKFGEIA